MYICVYVCMCVFADGHVIAIQLMVQDTVDMCNSGYCVLLRISPLFHSITACTLGPLMSMTHTHCTSSAELP